MYASIEEALSDLGLTGDSDLQAALGKLKEVNTTLSAAIFFIEKYSDIRDAAFFTEMEKRNHLPEVVNPALVLSEFETTAILKELQS